MLSDREFEVLKKYKTPQHLDEEDRDIVENFVRLKFMEWMVYKARITKVGLAEYRREKLSRSFVFRKFPIAWWLLSFLYRRLKGLIL